MDIRKQNHFENLCKAVEKATHLDLQVNQMGVNNRDRDGVAFIVEQIFKQYEANEQAEIIRNLIDRIAKLSPREASLFVVENLHILYQAAIAEREGNSEKSNEKEYWKSLNGIISDVYAKKQVIFNERLKDKDTLHCGAVVHSLLPDWYKNTYYGHKHDK